MADVFINIPDSGSHNWKDPVGSAALLPATGNSIGDTRIDLATNTIYVWNGTSWIAVATPGAAIAINALIGDVTATGPGAVPATVQFVGGVSAANVASGANLANASTSANTPNTIVKRDGSGNFSAGTITASLTGNVLGNLTGNVTGNVSGTASNVTGIVLPVNGGTGIANNNLSTITISGSFPLSLGLSASTSVTLPISGTLATLAGVETLTNKTINGLNNTITNISLTSSVTGILPIANGGTGSATQNFVDLTTAQTVAGNKTFSGQTAITNATSTAFTVNSTTLVVDASAGAVGINVAPAATAVLDVVNNSGTTKAIQTTGYGSNVGFRARRANGTLASPTQSLSADTLSFFSGRGYGATGFAAASTGVININATENFTDTSMATAISFSTTPTASVTSTERMRINSTGNVLIGTVTDNNNNKLQVNGSMIVGTFALTDAANIATNVSLANRFTVTLAGNRNLSAPTNPTDGQKVTWIFTQDATGGRTLTYDAIFDFGNMPTLILSTAANKRDYLGAIYNSAATKWDVVAYSSSF